MADMVSQKALENVKKLLKTHNQAHLLAFWDRLEPTQRLDLLTEIGRLDFSKIDDWVANFIRNSDTASIFADIAPAQSFSAVAAGPQQRRKYAQAVKLGKELIQAGKVAAFVVAGGQGTRLGYDGPKGNLPISGVKNKTLFQLFAESITAASEKYQTICRWYIMTSALNHSQTVQIFRSNNYYGLDEKSVFIFQQGTLPNFNFDGKILLADEAVIASSPDGHGGSLKALYQSGALEDMKKHGLEYISYFQVDNPLINIFDPLFIGLHALEKAEMSSKAVFKTDPKEGVGVFCLLAGRVNVIEYSNLPDELAEKRNPDGSLTFGLANIAIHIINTNFVEKLNVDGFSLPLHRAVKKIPHIDEAGRLVEPAEPNGIKLESFVFDALSLASKSIIYQTVRSEEFGPVKNAAGPDSPATARKMMTARAADWLESAGVKVPRTTDGQPDCLIEIAPSFALEKEDVKPKVGRIPQIKPADKIYLA
jgi:UDP-N-acetylglucosamine/UDP-N-acetylgalactosamine diphosphorylase